MPVSRKSKKNISKKRKTNKNIRKMKGGDEGIFYINRFGKDYKNLNNSTSISKKFLELFKKYDPFIPGKYYRGPPIIVSETPATKIRIFDNFNRLLGEIKPDELGSLSRKISDNNNEYINLINPELSDVILSDNNLKLIKFEITYDNSKTKQD